MKSITLVRIRHRRIKMLLLLFVFVLLTTELNMTISLTPRIPKAKAVTASNTKLYVDPPLVTRDPGGLSFYLYVRIANVTSLYTWAFTLQWNIGLLQCTAVAEITSFFDGDFSPLVYPDHVDVGSTLLGSAPGETGSGTLVRFTLKAIGTGNGTISIENSQLFSATGLMIDHTVANGYFYTAYPVAKFTYSPVGDVLVGEDMTFNASLSYDPDDLFDSTPGGITNWEWDFNYDGIFDIEAVGVVVHYNYTVPGTHQVKLQVTDDEGQTYQSDMLSVTVVSEGKYGYCTPDFSKAPSPGYYDTSEYMLGSVAVGVILPESEGPAYNWTDTEIQTSVDGVLRAMDWWKSENPEAQLSFVFDVHVRVPTVYEPIQMYEGEDFIWIADVMSHFGYTSGSVWDSVTQYNNDIRRDSGTDWAFTIFIVDSDDSVNLGRFPDGGYAHAYLGGPWITMSKFSSWAYNSAAYYIAVPAHEMGHIFYATDEYDTYTTYSGYFNATDRYGSFGIMNRNNFQVSTSTKLQIGWRDTDLDGVLDILDTHPAIRLDDYPPLIVQNSHEFSGTVVEVPHQNFNPFGQRNNLSINEIVSVEYSFDDGPWMPSTPVDGAFDETLESFTFTVVFGTEGTHTLRIRATNSIGNSRDEIFAVENTFPFPVASFTYSPSVPIIEETTSFDASSSYDPMGGWIDRYDWDFGDGTTLSESDPFASHVFTELGSFMVRLTVTNNLGQTDAIQKILVVKQRSTISVSANPNPVSIGSYTTIRGVLLPIRVGAVVTLEWRRYPWQSWMLITNVITDEESEYSYAWFWMPQEMGSLEIRASWLGDEVTLPAENVVTLSVILPTPEIVLDRTSGPVGTKVSVRGFNFTSSMPWYLSFDDQLVGIIFSTQTGEFNVTFSVPLSDAGTHKIKAIPTNYYMYNPEIAEATFTVIDTSPLDVNVDVGSIYFKQETAEIYVQTAIKGITVNVTSLRVTLLLPNGTMQALTAQLVDTGFYRISYVIHGKGSMTGTYGITVEASYNTDTVQASGSALKTFLVKPTWERELPRMAALSIAAVGLIGATIFVWRRENKRFP